MKLTLTNHLKQLITAIPTRRTVNRKTGHGENDSWTHVCVYYKLLKLN